MLQVFREDGVPENVPLMITESNLSWALTEPMSDLFAALWLADNAGSFLANGGAVFYHSPIQPEPLRSGCQGFATYGNFVANEKLEVRQHTRSILRAGSSTSSGSSTVRECINWLPHQPI